MTISIVHFDDSADSHNSVCINALSRSNVLMYEKEIVKNNDLETLVGVSLKLEGRVSVMPSTYFYKFFDTSSNDLSLVSQYFDKTPFPICVRYKSEKCIVIERPPFKVSPNIRYGKRSWRNNAKYQKEADIWIPWTVMILTTNKSFNNSDDRAAVIPYLFFRDAPLTSFDDLLGLPYTPNVFRDGRICLGESENRLAEKINNKEFLISDIADLYYFIANEYFMGGWNLDLQIPALSFPQNYLASKNVFSYIKELAQKTGNKYILSCFKKHGMDFNPFEHYNEKYSIRFYLNYLSCLSLDEILLHTKKMLEDFPEYNSYSRTRGNKKPFTLGDVLFNLDEFFNDFYKDKYKKDNDNYNCFDLENSLPNDLVRYCSSSSVNQTPLHTIKFIIKFNMKDFFAFASERVLNKHFIGPEYWELQKARRQEFYQKNIADSINKYPQTLNAVIYNYFSKIHSGNNSAALAKAIDSVMKNLGAFYRTPEGLQQIKNVVTINLTELGIVLDKSSLDEEVLA